MDLPANSARFLWGVNYNCLICILASGKHDIFEMLVPEGTQGARSQEKKHGHCIGLSATSREVSSDMLRPRPRLICFVGVGGRELVSDLLSSPVTSREVSSDMLHPRPRLICFVGVGGREVVSDLLSSPATSREASSDMLRPRPRLICFVGVGDREVVSDLLSSPATSREVSSDMLRSRPRLICFVGVGGFRSALLVVLSAASAAVGRGCDRGRYAAAID
nr:hypothetical protein Iba_scaffold9920CG0150 [Ipomoea batatas]